MGPVYRIPACIKGLAFSNAGPKISSKILKTKLATTGQTRDGTNMNRNVESITPVAIKQTRSYIYT